MIPFHRLRTPAAFVLLLAVLTAGAAAAPDPTALVFNPTADTLPLYAEASFTEPPAAQYYNGTFVTIMEEDGAFAKVTIGNDGEGTASGYMEAEHLIRNAATLSVRSKSPVLTIQNDTGTGLNLRMSPAVDSAQPPVMLCQNGTDVLVLGVWDGWLHVQVMDGGTTGFVQTFGVPMEQAEPGAASGRLHAHQTLFETHGYTVDASVTEAEPGEYTFSVYVSLNGVMMNGILVAYHAYADGAYLCTVDAAGWVGDNSAEGAPVYFTATAAAPETVIQIELRPVWSRSGFVSDGTEEPDAENVFVFTRGE